MVVLEVGLSLKTFLLGLGLSLGQDGLGIFDPDRWRLRRGGAKVPWPGTT